MKTSIVERAVVYAVIDGTAHSDRDGLIQAICPDRIVADRYLSDQMILQEMNGARCWRVVEFSIASLIAVPVDLQMLYVVYESDDDGVRPVYLTHRERLAQMKFRELDVDAQIRLLNHELTGQIGSRTRYWWERCPVVYRKECYEHHI